MGGYGTIPIRQMIRKDLPQVLAIEEASFRSPWSREGFLAALGRTDILTYVYAPQEGVLGYIMIELVGPEAHIINLAVHPDHRRHAVATECLRYADHVARRRGAGRIVLEVEESNLPAQLLYRKAGYRATRILRNYYPDTQEDGYRMVRALRGLARSAT